MLEPTVVRRATAADVEGIANVHVRAWHESYRGMVPDWAIDSRTIDERRANWKEWLQRARWYTHVAEVHGDIVAFACAFADSAEPGYDAYLNTLYVLQRAQRRGIARALMRAVVDDLRAEGRTSMWWLTLKENPACAFYQRVGAIVIRDQPAPAELGPDVVDRVFGLQLERFASENAS